MKNYSKVIVSLALIITLVTEPQQSPKKTYNKQNAKAASRPARKPTSRQAAKPAPKRIIAKTDKELLQDQIKALPNDWVLNHNRELKNFYYNNLCPIKYWTKQDRINTSIWVRKAYAIFKKGPDKKGTQMPSPEDFFYTVLNKLFKISPGFLELNDLDKFWVENDLSMYISDFVKNNMKTDLNNIKPYGTKETLFDDIVVL